MMFYLYWDESAHQDGSKLCRSTYSSLKEAKEQAKHDLEYGRVILGIEESDGELGGKHRTALERGKFVWKPDSDQE